MSSFSDLQVNDKCDDSSSDISSDECSEKSLEDNFLMKSTSSKVSENTVVDIIPEQREKFNRGMTKYSSGTRTKFYELEAGQEVSVLSNSNADRHEIDW